MKEKEVRKLRTYKAADKKYERAKKRCDKHGKHLATIIESVVKSIAEGADYVNFFLY